MYLSNKNFARLYYNDVAKSLEMFSFSIQIIASSILNYFVEDVEAKNTVNSRGNSRSINSLTRQRGSLTYELTGFVFACQKWIQTQSSSMKKKNHLDARLLLMINKV